MENETEIVKKYVQNLSEGMKDYLITDTWTQKLSSIIQSYKILEPQASAIKTEVFLILIGIENYSDLKTNIQKNVAGIGYENMMNMVSVIERNIFSEIKPLLEEIEKTNNEAQESEDKNLSKDEVLNDIENPVPAKPTVQNPAGKNVVLDAQHNLPEQEKKILIPSTAVPSRGPMLGNFRNQPIKPTQTTKSPYTVDPYREPPE